MTPTFKQTLAAVVLAGFAAAAHAQYIWLDDKGVKQFSDMPPPASVPKNRILKEPGASRPSASSSAEAASAAGDKKAASAPAPKAPLTAAEQNAEFKKRKAEQEKKEKEEAEKARITEENQKNCDRARDYHRALSSGQRIGQTGKDGERSFMTDEQRAKDIQEVEKTLSKCK